MPASIKASSLAFYSLSYFAFLSISANVIMLFFAAILSSSVISLFLL
jgi:hypothetical protein